MANKSRLISFNMASILRRENSSGLCQLVAKQTSTKLSVSITRPKCYDCRIYRVLTIRTAAAKVAFKSWSRTTIEHRREKVKQFIELWGNYHAEFTELLHQENGKPVRPIYHTYISRILIQHAEKVCRGRSGRSRSMAFCPISPRRTHRIGRRR